MIFFLKMPDRGNGPEREIEAGRQIEIDESHPYWISGNNVDGFVITQERSRHGR